MLARLRRTTRDDQGASAVEYGLLVAAIAAVIIVAVFAFGGFVRDVFDNTCETLQGSPTLSESSCEPAPGPS
ncbi:MAG: Flp family type IVb pilin [Kineosporiaceae bacterium]